jgi:hypothetical protein
MLGPGFPSIALRDTERDLIETLRQLPHCVEDMPDKMGADALTVQLVARGRLAAVCSGNTRAFDLSLRIMAMLSLDVCHIEKSDLFHTIYFSCRFIQGAPWRRIRAVRGRGR